MSQGKKPSEKHLYEIVDIYIKAHASSTSVQRAVADHFGIPLSTATKQIMVTRSRGMLPSIEELRLRKQYDKAKRDLEQYVSDTKLRLATTTQNKKE
jgi:hypothetical protein